MTVADLPGLLVFITPPRRGLCHPGSAWDLRWSGSRIGAPNLRLPLLHAACLAGNLLRLYITPRSTSIATVSARLEV